MITLLIICLTALLLIPLYFFIVTRGSLIIENLITPHNRRAHIYWIYSKRTLIRLTDRQFIISAILFFNYDRLVTLVLSLINPGLEGKDVLQLSCAFGNITERLAGRCYEANAKQLVIVDLIKNELEHTREKLANSGFKDKTLLTLSDAISISAGDESFDYVVSFFLFHELPMDKKVAALKEAARVLRPGGRIIFGEFARPDNWALRYSGILFFWIFEKYARQMWLDFVPEDILMKECDSKWEFTQQTFFAGNYQVVSARKIKN